MEFHVSKADDLSDIEKELQRWYAEGWRLVIAYYQPVHGPKHVLIFQRG